MPCFSPFLQLGKDNQPERVIMHGAGDTVDEPDDDEGTDIAQQKVKV